MGSTHSLHSELLHQDNDRHPKKRQRDEIEPPNVSKKMREFRTDELMGELEIRGADLDGTLVQDMIERKYIMKNHDDESSDDLKLFHGTSVDSLLPVLAKVIIKKQENARIMKEIEILKSLKHRNILNVIDFYETKHKSCAILESFEKNTLVPWILQTHKKSFSEGIIQKICRDILNGLQYLHSMGVIHRNLKLDNIIACEFNSSINFKITDFKYAKELNLPVSEIDPNNQEELKSINLINEVVGTFAYLSPEQIQIYKQLKQDGYGPMVDIWNFGCVLYELCFGFHPFEVSLCDGIVKVIGEEEEEEENDKGDAAYLSLFERISDANFPKEFEEYDKISQPIRTIFGACFQINPSKRCTALEALSSDFINLELSCEHSQHAYRNLEILQVRNTNHSKMFQMIEGNIQSSTKTNSIDSDNNEEGSHMIKRQPRRRSSAARRNETL